MYSYFGYGVSYDVRRQFSLSNGGGFGKYIKIFGAGMSSSFHVDDNKKIYPNSW